MNFLNKYADSITILVFFAFFVLQFQFEMVIAARVGLTALVLLVMGIIYSLLIINEQIQLLRREVKRLERNLTGIPEGFGDINRE